MYRMAFIIFSCIALFLFFLPRQAASQTVMENNPADCSDGMDNDGNGLVDCNDPNCAILKICHDGAAAAQPVPENTMQACSDGLDNDGDSFIDCADQDCSALTVCAKPGGENTAEACSDGLDNDGNGFIDCKETSCAAFVFCSGMSSAAGQTSAAPRLAGPPRSSGWALGAAIFGFVVMGPVTGLLIAAEITKHDMIPSMPLGVTGLALHIAGVPIVAGGASSARRKGMVGGCLGCRIAGWIIYGIGIADGIALVALGSSGITPYDSMVAIVGFLSLTSFILHCVDALAARGQVVSSHATGRTATVREGQHGVAWIPFIAPVVSNGRVIDTTLGLAAVF
jgi:hypothetical protein